MNSRLILIRRLVPAACIATCLIAGVGAAQTTSDADKIMQSVYAQDTSHDLTLKADFQVFDKQGQSTKKEFTLMRIGAPGASKTLAAFTAPKEIRGVVLLSIDQRDAPASQYVYTPATQRVRSVVPQERSASFIGTDFTFEDIGNHVLADFDYKTVGDQESIDGHKTYKIMATPVATDRSQYRYIYYWVAQ